MATATTTATQPQDLEAEAALLGAILLNPQAIAEVDDILRYPDFFDKRHEHIYQAALAVYRTGKDIDIITLGSSLKDHGKFKSIGGNEYLNKLINTVPTAAHIKSYAELIINKARRRGLIEAAANFNNLARDQKKDTNQIIEMAEIQLFNVSEQHVEQNIVHLRDILSESFERLQYLQANKSELRGIASGFGLWTIS